MALFKSQEEIQAEQEKKTRKLLKQYGVDTLSDPADLASVQRIATELAGSGLMEIGTKLQLAKPEIQLPISYQRAIVEQNFIIIRQLDKIAKLLGR